MKKLLLSQLLVLGLFMFLPHSVDAQYLALEYATQFHPLGRSVILQLASERARQTTLVCEDKQLKALWRKMMGSQAFKTYVDIGNYSKINKIDCANEFEVRLIDVNNDGAKEIAVKGKWAGNFCGMYSGCSFWLFQKK